MPYWKLAKDIFFTFFCSRMAPKKSPSWHQNLEKWFGNLINKSETKAMNIFHAGDARDATKVAASL